MSEPKPLTVPPFESKLPVELMSGLDERGQFLYKKLDEIGMAQTWLITQAVDHARILNDVKSQTEKTNGRTAKNEDDIRVLQSVTEPVVKTFAFTLGAVKSKWFWVGAVLFFTVGVPWLSVHATGVLSFIKAFALG